MVSIILSGTESELTIKCVHGMLEKDKGWINPFGGVKAVEMVVKEMES